MTQAANETPEQRAVRLDAAGRCVKCEKVDPVRRRGLCNTHYTQFHKARTQLSDELAEEFERMLIENGELLPSRQGKRCHSESDSYAALAAMLLGGDSDEESLQREAIAILHKVDRIQAEQQKRQAKTAKKRPSRS